MATHNSYPAYKRDTQHLLYWMTTVSGFVTMSEAIVKHINPVPSLIYRLFQSVIQDRSAAHAVFQQIAKANPDPEIEKSNASHKFFIDTLTKAFEILGGKTWTASQSS
ncbi:hypothetical protein NKR23_g212 [Pleurostoma richardsiae]|uniref:DUF6604 domain-containing protein n=1 Tax=Pleurostoma richardsiae TaxID=41990 RepID=A0AA38VY50_9PEZI|nr:hypothetical protein NKR23_g212 [Pleurostoma richardsiae]